MLPPGNQTFVGLILGSHNFIEICTAVVSTTILSYPMIESDAKDVYFVPITEHAHDSAAR